MTLRDLRRRRELPDLSEFFGVGQRSDRIFTIYLSRTFSGVLLVLFCAANCTEPSGTSATVLFPCALGALLTVLGGAELAAYFRTPETPLLYSGTALYLFTRGAWRRVELAEIGSYRLYPRTRGGRDGAITLFLRSGERLRVDNLRGISAIGARLDKLI